MLRIGMSVILVLLAAPMARANDLAGCRQGENSRLKVRACSAVISSGTLQGRDLSWVFDKRGLGRARLGQHERALEDYARAIELDPRNAIALSNRANSLRHTGKLGEAVDDFTRSIRIAPRRYHPYMGRGLAAAAQGSQFFASRDWDTGFNLGGGEAIRAYQQWMKRHGHYTGRVDGIDGPNTRRALLACARDPAC